MAGPTFIGVGMQKSGTRWLYEQLRDHPDFWMPPVKELRFFTSAFPFPEALSIVEKPWRLEDEADRAFADLLRGLAPGRHGMETYRALFAPAGERHTGEITPDYASLPDRRIDEVADAFPRLRVILMVRDPVSRAWTALNDAVNDGKLDPAAVAEPRAMLAALATPSFLGNSFPSQAYARWSRRLAVKAILLQDVAADAAAARAEALTFLGASTAPGRLPPSHNSKAGRPRARMGEALREALVAHFADELRRCAALFGGSAAEWPALHGLDPAPPPPAEAESKGARRYRLLRALAEGKAGPELRVVDLGLERGDVARLFVRDGARGSFAGLAPSRGALEAARGAIGPDLALAKGVLLGLQSDAGTVARAEALGANLVIADGAIRRQPPEALAAFGAEVERQARRPGCVVLIGAMIHPEGARFAERGWGHPAGAIEAALPGLRPAGRHLAQRVTRGGVPLSFEVLEFRR